jgi:hypothetical protein
VDARTWHCRPSDLLRIEYDYVAYCVDQAVAYFGRHLDAELNSVDAKDEADARWKRQAILDRYLSDGKKPAKGRFADPAAMLGKK